MKVFVCLDDDNGTMFNERRQSSDAEVINDIVNTVKEQTLFIDAYSQKLFHDAGCKVSLFDENLLNSGENIYYFSETGLIAAYGEHIEELIIYRWNRRYPSDVQTDIDLKKWKLRETFDFVGKSHEKITREVYSR